MNFNIGPFNKIVAYILISLALLPSITSCRQKKDDDLRHPFFVKASCAKENKDYQSAEQAFIEYLEARPRSPKGHLEMASLYNDCLDEPVKAVYHYKRFLELNKNSSDEENIKSLIAAAEKKISFGYLNVDASSIEQLISETRRLKENEKKNHEKIELLRKENDYLRKASGISITSGETLQRKKILPAPAQMESSSSAVKPVPTENAESHSVRYTVQMGDTLTKISRKFYGDGKYYKKILDANKEVLPSEETPLLPGQEIIIPRLYKE